MENTYSTVMTENPRTRILDTSGGSGTYGQYVGIQVPTIPAVDAGNGYGRAYVAQTEAAGQSPWFYSCVSYGITIPEQGVRDRLIPVYGFNSGAEGYLYWGLNYGFATATSGFPTTPWGNYRSKTGVMDTMGDGCLMYPSAPYSLPPAPMPSTRLTNFRDGMEDYEMLNQLSRLFALKQSLLSATAQTQIEGYLDCDSLLSSTGAWADFYLADQRRRDVGDWIDELTTMSPPLADITAVPGGSN